MKRIPFFLLCAFILIWVALAIKPLYRFDWLLENLLVFISLPLVFFLHRKDYLSVLSYAFIFIFLVLHCIGAHYTYSEVPAGYTISHWFGAERNHYDRIVHFLFGFLLTKPASEIIHKKISIPTPAALLFSFSLIATIGVLYELLEWVVAVVVDPKAGAAYLGSQGDEWDAQKDLLCKMTGSLLSVFSVQKISLKSGV
jgi:putative membrane protein